MALKKISPKKSIPKIKSSKKRKAKQKPTAQELEQKAFRKDVRTIFRNIGFIKVNSVSDKEFTFRGHTSDFDDVFIYENIFVFTEYTITKTNAISGHLKPKKLVYDEILKNKVEFIEFFESNFSTFKDTRDDIYNPAKCYVIILYCPKNSIDTVLKNNISEISYFEYPTLMYFKSVSGAIKKSARFEIFNFLKLKNNQIGPAALSPAPTTSNNYHGSVLPESHSNYKKGYKVVSFYVDPESLLTRSYVHRNDGWNDSSGLYQRMISNSKILSIRRYLNDSERVFINNIIVTLPESTKILDDKSNTINPASISSTVPATIQIPLEYNVVGIIDGQHRVFSYHEGGKFDEKISRLRIKQNLLATGIIYPATAKPMEKTKFEANLFMEINSNQTSAKSDLKQAISLILNPFSSEAIAKAVLNKLNNQGALQDVFERHFYEKGKLKTSSIVSFALKPIVKTSGSDSLFSAWSNTDKLTLVEKKDGDLLDQYVDYCTSEISIFFAAAKYNINNRRWTADKGEDDRVLTVTIINGFIICLRKIIENKNLYKFKTYQSKFSNINSFDFSKYKSSQYSRMAEDLFVRYFS